MRGKFQLRGIFLFSFLLCALTLVGLTVAPFSFADDKSDSNEPLRYDYTPGRSVIKRSPSIEVAKNWNEVVQFQFNRGSDLSPQDDLLEMLDPANIAKVEGFTKPSNTLITLMTYEVRSREVVERIDDLLQRGFKVRVISDPSTYKRLVAPTKAEWNRWSSHQRHYFLRKYTRNKTDNFTQEDIDRYNKSRNISITLWETLEELQSKFGKNQLELISPPYERVPASDENAYIRLTHFKLYMISTLDPKSRGANRAFVPRKAKIGSYNLTYSCMLGQLVSSPENRQCYIDGKDYKKAWGSDGHIQFWATVEDADTLSGILGPTEDWIAAYKKGKHFDELPTRETSLPQVLFQSKNGKHSTTLQGFFSEGTHTLGRRAIDPVYQITSLLSQPDVELKVYYDAQYVFTHSQLAKHLRHHLARGTVEAFAVFVDGHFATQPHSALPHLLFAPRIDRTEAALPGRSVEDYVSIAEELEWEKNTYVYQGDKGMGTKDAPDKLHSKVTYFEYEANLKVEGGGNQRVRHYVVVWGSANKSTSAGKLNADATFILDSTDPSVGRQMRPFFDALRTDRKIKPYPSEYLEFVLRQSIVDDPKIFSEKFLGTFQKMLDEGEGKKTLSRIVAKLEGSGTATPTGENLITIMQWLKTHASKTFKMTWTEFYLLLELANQNNLAQTGFVTDLAHRWLEIPADNTYNKREQKKIKDFYAMVRGLKRTEFEPEKPKSTALERIRKNCEEALTRLGLLPGEVYYEGEDI